MTSRRTKTSRTVRVLVKGDKHPGRQCYRKAACRPRLPLLDPVVSRIREDVLKADKINADETRVRVLDSGRGKTATGRRWVYATDDRASGSTAPSARHGTASRPTAPRRTRCRTSPAFVVTSRLPPMPVMTDYTAAASPRVSLPP